METPGQEGRPYTYTPRSSAAAAVSADAPDDQCNSGSWAGRVLSVGRGGCYQLGGACVVSWAG
eukprot:COSAG01_NODE_57558_length_311_cov_1.216981_1_plen_62_part_10